MIPVRITPWSTSGSLFRSPSTAFKGANFLVVYIIHIIIMGQNDLKPIKKTLRRIVVWFNQKCQLSSGRKSWWLCCVSQCAQCALCNVHNVHPESWATIRDLIQFHSSTSSSNNQKFNCEQITRTKDLIQYHTISTSFSNNQVRKFSSK